MKFIILSKSPLFKEFLSLNREEYSQSILSPTDRAIMIMLFVKKKTIHFDNNNDCLSRLSS